MSRFIAAFVLYTTAVANAEVVLIMRGITFIHIYVLHFQNTVNSRYLEVVGTIFYKFKLPEVQINLHFG